MERPIAGDRFTSTSSASREEEVDYRSIQEPQDDLWNFTQNAASPQAISPECIDIYPEFTDRAPCSDSDLLSLEGISLHSPDITPSSPSLPSTPVRPKSPPVPVQSSRKKYRFLDTVSKTISISKNLRNVTLGGERHRSPTRKVTAGAEIHKLSPAKSPTRKVTCGPEAHFSSPTRSPIRKATSPAKMMRTSQYSEHNVQEWNRLATEAQKFDFGFDGNHGPLSPPPSAKVSEASETSSSMLPSNEHENGFAWAMPQYSQQGRPTHTPLATPTTNMQPFAQPQMQNPNGNGMMFSHGPPEHQPEAPWGQHVAPHLIDQDYNQFVPPNYIQEPQKSPMWWNHASTAPMAHPAPTVYHRSPSDDMATVAHQLQNELAYNATELALSPSNFQNGLNIQLPHTPVHQSFVVTSSPSHEYFTTQPPPDNQPRHRYTHSQPNPRASPRIFTTPTMRKSRSRGDIHESPSPTSGPRTPSYSIQKQRSSSAGRNMARRPSEHHPATPKTPKTPKGGATFGEFVNFTPSDSTKILTGVAPSGSSKTKARREKEAMEKRRKLSLAAVKAVQAAGGNIESLVEEGLLV